MKIATHLTVMPILVEPEKLSKQELVDKCREQQQTMILQDKMIQEMTAKLFSVSVSAHELGVQLYALLDSFDENDRPAVTLQLRQMSERRKTYRKTEVH